MPDALNMLDLVVRYSYHIENLSKQVDHDKIESDEDSKVVGNLVNHRHNITKVVENS